MISAQPTTTRLGVPGGGSGADAPHEHESLAPWDEAVIRGTTVVPSQANQGGGRLGSLSPGPRHRLGVRGPVDSGLATRPDWSLMVLLVVALVVLLVVVAGFTMAIKAADDDEASSSPAAPVHGTLLVVVDDGAGSLVAGALLGVDGDSATSVLVPSGLGLDGQPAGRRILAQALDVPAMPPQALLGAQLGVRIDQTLRLSPTALAGLVDASGGVVVDVDREVVAGEVYVPAGDGQRLTGEQAAAYAAALADDEPEESRLARFGEVLSAVIAQLPPGQDRLRIALSGLTGASVSARLGEVAAVLDELREVAGANGISTNVLPVTVRVATASDQAAYSLDVPAASALFARHLPHAVLPEPTTGALRVLVRNGEGTPGLSDAARQRLQAVGLRFVRGGNAATFENPTSSVLVPASGAAEMAAAREVAAALGLGQDTIAVDQGGTPDADVVVVLGQDFADDILERGVLPRASVRPTT